MKKILVTGGSGFIGSHLVSLLIKEGYQVINIDIAPPVISDHKDRWQQCSILDKPAFERIFLSYSPSLVVHLAAYASMEASSIDEFLVNTQGTSNLLDVVRKCLGVKRVIITSTQHVRMPGAGYPMNDTDYLPYMLYGESKVITEEVTRDSQLDCAWTIVRPTAVWGPGHKLLAEGLWRLMFRNRYFHPKNDQVIRSYGYVENLVWQIEQLLRVDRKEIDRKTFYLADGNGRQLDWVNAISLELKGHAVTTVPLWALKVISSLGDLIRACGLRFPLYNSRLRNLTTSNPVPVEPTLKLLGTPPYSMKQGAHKTAQWLKSYYKGGQE